jgi:hypothetical protein
MGGAPDSLQSPGSRCRSARKAIGYLACTRYSFTDNFTHRDAVVFSGTLAGQNERPRHCDDCAGQRIVQFYRGHDWQPGADDRPDDVGYVATADTDLHPRLETRMSMAATALENGAQLEDVQKAAGHRHPSTTKLYDRRGYNPEKVASFFATY